MIEFDGVYPNVKLTDDGRYIKIPIEDEFIKYIVGTLGSIDFEKVSNISDAIVRRYATHIQIGEIVAVKFQDGTLKKVVEGVEKLD